MKIILNLTTLVGGGALQVAVGFVHEAMQFTSSIEWLYLVSKPVKREFELAGFSTDLMIVFDASPAHSFRVRKEILSEIKKFNPRMVVTLFGPAYIKMPVYHIMGVGDGWVTHSDLNAFLSVSKSPIVWVRLIVKILFKKIWYKRANRWIVEAQCAKNGLIRRLKIPDKLINIIPNTCQQQYVDANERKKPLEVGETVNVLVFAGPYAHKNLHMIPDVAKY